MSTATSFVYNSKDAFDPFIPVTPATVNANASQVMPGVQAVTKMKIDSAASTNSVQASVHVYGT